MQSGPNNAFRSAPRLGVALTLSASSIFSVVTERPISWRCTSREPGCALRISFIRSTNGGVQRLA
ncbi:MAG: hypothetical protein ACK55I_16045, partial [bacterium]